MINLKGYFTRFGSKTDGSFSLAFTTQELTPEYAAEFARNLNLFGHIIFKEGDIQESEIPKDVAVDEDAKTPSQRLRAVIFLNWKQKNDGSDFDVFYRKEINKLIEYYKGKLD